MRKLWLAKLVEVGCILVKTNSEDRIVDSGLVLATNNYGVLLWRCVGRRRGDFKWWTFRAETTRSPWVEVRIVELERWMVFEVEALPPASLWARANFGGCRGPSEIVVAPISEKAVLLKYSAQRGFRTEW